jgi:hypothetical protein
LDSIYTRRKLNDIAEKILPGWSSQYSTIEHEMNLSPDWPPPSIATNDKNMVTNDKSMAANVNSMATNVKRVFQHKTIHMKELINTFMSLI